MRKTKNSNRTPKAVRTPEGEFSRLFLSHCKCIKEDKLAFLLLFSEMQRIYLVQLGKDGNSDEYLDRQANDLWYLEQMIVTA